MIAKKVCWLPRHVPPESESRAPTKSQPVQSDAISDSRKGYEPSLRVISRFCAILLFFVFWAAVRHWPYPLHCLGNMLKIAAAACLGLAMFRRERFADAHLNSWDEALAYFCVALFLDGLGV